MKVGDTLVLEDAMLDFIHRIPKGSDKIRTEGNK